jgi:hypothetical protein
MHNLANQELLISVGRCHLNMQGEKPNQFIEEEINSFILQEELQQKVIETAIKKHEFDQRKSEHDQRVAYASKLFIFISVWLTVLLLVLIASGSSCKYFSLEISDRVLITLLTTTTVAVLWLFITVLRYIFGRK